MTSIAPEPLQVPRFIAKATAILLAALIAVCAIVSFGAPPGSFDFRLPALAGGFDLLLLLGTSAYLLRKGAGWPFIAHVWSYVLIAACIRPGQMLMRHLM